MIIDLAAAPLDDPDRLRALVGGKGASLARLLAAGLPVPPAIALSTELFTEHLRRHGLLRRARSGQDLSAELRALPIAPRLLARIQRRSRTLGPSLAVRSSAIAEDGASASFAGQHDTVLGVDVDGLHDAIRRCWASAWTVRARSYREARPGRGGGMPRMAVVIQRQLAPRCAGVLFTIDPSTGSWREMTVEAAWGQGEAVVSGAVVPEFHRVRRPRRLLSGPAGRAIARLRLQPTERVDGVQDHQLVLQGGDLVALPLSAGQRGRPCLDDAELLALCRLGLRIERAFGEPVDVEWAIDDGGQPFVLQARPVTAGDDLRRAGPVLWTRRFVGERWTVPATPLGWSLMRELLEHFIAYPETSRRFLGAAPPTRLVRHAPYFNVTLFRHLAFKAPGFPPPRFMVELLPPDEERGWLRRHAQAPDLRVYGSIFHETFREQRWQRFRWNPLTNWRAWDALLPRLDQQLAELEAPLTHRAEALARTETCMGLAREYVKVHICSLLFANIWVPSAQAALEARGRADLVPVLLRAPADSMTARTNRDLWRLGRGELARETFLDRHGHRADGSWELFAPRWREQPGLVDELAATAARGPDPAIAAAAHQQDARAGFAEIAGPTGALVTLARRYLALREDQRYWFDRILWAWKQAWRWLEDDEDLALRFLERAEVRALRDGELDRGAARALVERRRGEWEEEAARRAAGDEPPEFIVGEEALAGIEPDRPRLEGVGISAGVATGPARIVRSPADAHRLRPGDILVARATDPAWTPLFLDAGGLVMELGGMLSHGAVVAREYRLPAVVGVRGACQRLEDGQTITIDGGRGVVWVR
ncbi:MAG: hypothetical protein H6742_04585 [Alphaproteobacteria bacterium]|nr:hypothetical protein [Alphaproteobacteria bacterium]